MDLTYSAVALLFPATPLMFLVYANTSLAIGARIREIYEKHTSSKLPKNELKLIREELQYLAKRATLLRTSQLLAGITFIFNVYTLFSIYAAA